MKSKWYDKKPLAQKLRKRGLSIRDIEDRLSIPRSTLSGWLRGIELSKKQHGRLYDKWIKGLVKARKRSNIVHREQKLARLEQARIDAHTLLKMLDGSPATTELALAFLYLGEGFKRADYTAMGNSDPRILKFFIAALKKLYNIDPSQLRCELHLRADQKPVTLKRYWARELGLPITTFKYVTHDQRTVGSKTFKGYHGVCTVVLFNVSYKRKLLALSELYCESIIASMGP